jgi:putative peptidoglycan lipid II flippase
VIRRLRTSSASTRALVGTGIGSLPGFVLPFALTWRLGAGRLTDAYFLALALAMFVSGVLGNVLEVNVLPAAIAYKRGGQHRLESFVRRTVAYAAGIACVSYVPVAAVGWAIVTSRHSWTKDEKSLCLTLIAVFAVYIVATAMTSVLDATLYALDGFFASTVSQCIRALLPLAFLVLTSRSTAGVLFTAALLAGGELLRAILLWQLARRRMRGLVADGSAIGPSRLLAASVPSALSLFVVSASPLVDKIVASPLGAGSVTVLELGEKVFFVPFLALSSSIVLVAGARWAHLARDDFHELPRDFKRTLRLVVGLSCISAIGIALVVAGVTLIAGNRFLGLAAGQFRLIVFLFLAGLPGAVVGNQGARLMTALQRTRALPIFAVAAFSVNILSDVIGAHYLGVSGIALASTLFRYGNAALYVVVCSRLVQMVATPDAPLSGSPLSQRLSVRFLRPN